MNVDPESKFITRASPTFQISLHPLVIISVSDYYTREKAITENPNPLVIGALMGTQDGRKLEICNSFEMKYESNSQSGNSGQSRTIDKELFNTKLEQFNTVFSEFDFLGWYATCDVIDERIMEMQKQVMNLGENIIFLQLKPKTDSGQDLPISVYETVMDVEGETPRVMFVNIPYSINTGEAERVTVDDLTKFNSNADSTVSCATDYMNSMQNAVTMLHQRIRILLHYLLAVKKGQLPMDHKLLRKISSFCNLLPLIDTAEFKENYSAECQDALLMSYLATITKALNAMEE
eukprot:Nk52_evm1s1984 gene=Nk52_evmTU1s1984